MNVPAVVIIIAVCVWAVGLATSDRCQKRMAAWTSIVVGLTCICLAIEVAV